MPRFPLGRLLATPAALDLLAEVGVAPLTLIGRHARGDWGDMDDEDRQANEDALQSGARVFSSYKIDEDRKVWVITEAASESGGREATTVLLPGDY